MPAVLHVITCVPVARPDAEELVEQETGYARARVGIHQRAGISFWDSMIVHLANEMGCAVLYSEDPLDVKARSALPAALSAPTQAVRS